MKGNPNRIKGKFYIKSRYIFLILALACLGLIIFSSLSVNVAKPLKDATSTILIPVQKGINSIGFWFSSKTDNLRELKTVTAENEELKEKVDRLTLENTTLLQQQSEFERLQELYDLDSTYSSYPKVASRIIAKDPGNWFSVFTIDKGSKDGIKVDMNVIGNGGLVGIVIDVGKHSATVRSIIDDESSVGAAFSTTSDICIVKGNLTLMDKDLIDIVSINKEADVKEGDMIVTSQVSDKYLPGILIGYLKDIEKDTNNLTKSGHITPVVDFSHIEEVLVITQLKEKPE